MSEIIVRVDDLDPPYEAEAHTKARRLIPRTSFMQSAHIARCTQVTMCELDYGQSLRLELQQLLVQADVAEETGQVDRTLVGPVFVVRVLSRQSEPVWERAYLKARVAKGQYTFQLNKYKRTGRGHTVQLLIAVPHVINSIECEDVAEKPA